MRERLLALALALALLGTACSRGGGRGGEEKPPEGQYSVYFLSLTSGEEDEVLGREFRTLPSDVDGVEGLMEVLLSGPEDGTLTSPFPGNTTLSHWRLEEGLATIDLSEAYGGLNGIDMTLADACIVLTLCQLEGVDRVYLTVEGHPRPFRDQVLTRADILLEAPPAETP